MFYGTTACQQGTQPSMSISPHMVKSAMRVYTGFGDVKARLRESSSSKWRGVGGVYGFASVAVVCPWERGL